MSKKTVAIVPATAPEAAPAALSPRNVWKRRLHVTLAALVALPLPVLAATGFAYWFGVDQSLLGSTVSQTIVVLLLLGLTLHSTVVCSLVYLVLGVTGLVLGHWLLGDELVAALVLVGGAGLAGLGLAHSAYNRLRRGAADTPDCETREALNPRCANCHAKHFCPYQPGGLADRYTPKDQPRS